MSEKTLEPMEKKQEEAEEYGFAANDVIRFIKTLKIRKTNNLQQGGTSNVGIAQLGIRPYNSLPDYIREMNFMIEQAVNQRAAMVCFPEFTGLLPASLFPEFTDLFQTVPLNEATGYPRADWIIHAFSTLSAPTFEVYFSTMSALAASYGIYIMAGSTLYPENGTYHHRALLFSPNGQLAGYQDKLLDGHLEHSLQIEPAGRITLFDTPLGCFTILIGSDVFPFETTRISANLGAQMILNPTAFLAPYTGVNAADGLNLRVQEQPLYGIQSTLIGSTPLGITLEGPSGVFAPLRFSLPNAKNGMFLRTIKHNQTQLITARLNLDALKASVDPLTGDQSNSFMAHNIDLIY